MVQFYGSGLCIGAGHVRGDNAVAVQILTGNAFQYGLRFRVQLCKAAHRQHGVQSAEQVDGALHDQDDADGHHQRFHGAEGVCDQDDAQHHAEHRQQQKALPAVVAAAAQVQSVLHPANGVKDDEQAEHDGQNAYHDIAAQQQKNTQRKADKAGDQGKLALEHPALHHKVADQLHRCAGQHHAAQRVADDVTVYRQLEKLVKNSSVVKYTIDNTSSACFEYVGEDNQSKQSTYHLKCEHCGKIIHLSCNEIEEFENHISSHHNFKVDPAKTVFYGLCENCAK